MMTITINHERSTNGIRYAETYRGLPTSAHLQHQCFRGQAPSGERLSWWRLAGCLVCAKCCQKFKNTNELVIVSSSSLWNQWYWCFWRKKNIVDQSYNSNMNGMVFGEFGINPSLLPAAATKCPAQTSQFQSLRKTFGHEREYLDSYVPFCKWLT